MTQFAYTTAGTFQPKVTVVDNSGASASASTTVVVDTPAQALGTVTPLIQGLPLNGGQQNSLLSKLNVAAASINRGDVIAVCNRLLRFSTP
jgi:hypothetical protein